jgi:hypothetical protein
VIGWLFRPAPLGRIAALRTLVYLFVVFDLFVYTSWVRNRSDVPAQLYAPLRIDRILHIPAPTALLVQTVFWALLVAAILAATGRAPRLLGWTVFALYLEWLLIGFSFGKVDHDRFGFLVALAVLPTVGRARHGDASVSERAGWALRMTQMACVATYFFAAWAKLRFGGMGWMVGSVLARAIIRRGSELARLVATLPGILVAAQIGTVLLELLSPIVLFLRGRRQYAFIALLYSFHALTYLAIGISFAPQLVALTSFLPLERLQPIVGIRRLAGRRRPDPVVVPLSDAAPASG